MPKVVNVNGKRVFFPDDMDEASISAAMPNINRQLEVTYPSDPSSHIRNDARYGELGEYKRDWDGRTSTEYSITEYVPQLGGWVNIPSMVQGQTDVDNMLKSGNITPQQAKIAVKRAIERVRGGAKLPFYSSAEEAEQMARSRSDAEKMKPYVNPYSKQAEPTILDVGLEGARSLPDS